MNEIVIIVPHCYRQNDKRLKRFCEGLSIMVGVLIDNLDHEKLNIEVFMTNEIYSKKWVKENGITYYNSTLLRSICRIEFQKFYQFVKKDKFNIRKLYFDITDEAFFIWAKSSGKIINFHDLSESNYNIINKFMSNKIPFVLTLHLYIGKENIIDENYKVIESMQDKIFSNFNDKLIVVSNGMKKRILEDYKNIKESSITVIENGVVIPENYQNQMIQNKNLKKIFLCVGTIGKRKNQCQLLKSIKNLPNDMKENCYFKFCGVDTTNGEFENKIKEYGITKYVEYLGSVSKEKMPQLYMESFAVISCSLVEAFGLSIIEGYAYGKPAVFFYDIDAADSLFDEETAVMITGKGSDDIVRAMEICYRKRWDKDKIINFSKKFDIKYTTQKYVDYFESMQV